MTTTTRAPKGCKKITPSMEGGLKCLMNGKADFYELIRAGCNGAASSNLVKHGLATKITAADGTSEWVITEAGTTVLASGYYRPTLSE